MRSHLVKKPQNVLDDSRKGNEQHIVSVLHINARDAQH